MSVWKTRSKRRKTGGKVSISRKKRRFERGLEFLNTNIGKTASKKVRSKGGHVKAKALRAEFASVSDPKTGKAQKSKIVTVVSNPANPNYVRRNIITKGAIIRTELGEARVTSRPGQQGTITAVLVKAQ